MQTVIDSSVLTYGDTAGTDWAIRWETRVPGPSTYVAQWGSETLECCDKQTANRWLNAQIARHAEELAHSIEQLIVEKHEARAQAIELTTQLKWLEFKADLACNILSLIPAAQVALSILQRKYDPPEKAL